MDWYVIQAYSGYEQKVKMALEEKIELNNPVSYTHLRAHETG